MRFSSRLDLDGATSNVVRMLSQRAKDLDNISGKNPITIAGACIYFVAQLLGRPCSSASISAITGISETTIKSTHRILYDNRRAVLAPEILARCPPGAESNLRPQ